MRAFTKLSRPCPPVVRQTRSEVFFRVAKRVEPPRCRVARSGSHARRRRRETSSMRASSRALVALLALALCVAAEAFYLPGVAPQDYARDDIVYMKVNKLSSTRTQLPF